MPVFLMKRHIVDFDYLKPAGIRLLSDTGFGFPRTKTKKIAVERSFDLERLDAVICQGYPHLPLDVVGFEYYRCDPGRTLTKLARTDVSQLQKDLRKANCKRMLIIVPNEDLPDMIEGELAVGNRPKPPRKRIKRTPKNKQLDTASNSLEQATTADSVRTSPVSSNQCVDNSISEIAEGCASESFTDESIHHLEWQRQLFEPEFSSDLLTSKYGTVEVCENGVKRNVLVPIGTTRALNTTTNGSTKSFNSSRPQTTMTHRVQIVNVCKQSVSIILPTTSHSVIERQLCVSPVPPQQRRYSAVSSISTPGLRQTSVKWYPIPRYPMPNGRILEIRPDDVSAKVPNSNLMGFRMANSSNSVNTNRSRFANSLNSVNSNRFSLANSSNCVNSYRFRLEGSSNQLNIPMVVKPVLAHTLQPMPRIRPIVVEPVVTANNEIPVAVVISVLGNSTCQTPRLTVFHNDLCHPVSIRPIGVASNSLVRVMDRKTGKDVMTIGQQPLSMSTTLPVASSIFATLMPAAANKVCSVISDPAIDPGLPKASCSVDYVDPVEEAPQDPQDIIEIKSDSDCDDQDAQNDTESVCEGSPLQTDTSGCDDEDHRDPGLTTSFLAPLPVGHEAAVKGDIESVIGEMNNSLENRSRPKQRSRAPKKNGGRYLKNKVGCNTGDQSGLGVNASSLPPIPVEHEPAVEADIEYVEEVKSFVKNCSRPRGRPLKTKDIECTTVINSAEDSLFPKNCGRPVKPKNIKIIEERINESIGEGINSLEDRSLPKRGRPVKPKEIESIEEGINESNREGINSLEDRSLPKKRGRPVKAKAIVILGEEINLQEKRLTPEKGGRPIKNKDSEIIREGMINSTEVCLIPRKRGRPCTIKYIESIPERINSMEVDSRPQKRSRPFRTNVDVKSFTDKRRKIFRSHARSLVTSAVVIPSKEEFVSEKSNVDADGKLSVHNKEKHTIHAEQKHTIHAEEKHTIYAEEKHTFHPEEIHTIHAEEKHTIHAEEKHTIHEEEKEYLSRCRDLLKSHIEPSVVNNDVLSSKIRFRSRDEVQNIPTIAASNANDSRPDVSLACVSVERSSGVSRSSLPPMIFREDLSPVEGYIVRSDIRFSPVRRMPDLSPQTNVRSHSYRSRPSLPTYAKSSPHLPTKHVINLSIVSFRDSPVISPEDRTSTQLPRRDYESNEELDIQINETERSSGTLGTLAKQASGIVTSTPVHDRIASSTGAIAGTSSATAPIVTCSSTYGLTDNDLPAASPDSMVLDYYESVGPSKSQVISRLKERMQKQEQDLDFIRKQRLQM